MAAKHHITVAEIHENNAADLEKVTLIEKMNFKININTILYKITFLTHSWELDCIPIFTGKSTKQSQP